MQTPDWIFISPHLDDVALSCGGLVWDLTRAGDRVEVWTLMAGVPNEEDYSPFAQQTHTTWGVSGRDAVEARRAEDRAACAQLGAAVRHFDWLDAIYRRDRATGEPIVRGNGELFGSSPEPGLVDEIRALLDEAVPAGARLVLPIGLGRHIDHLAVVQAGARGRQADFYYADYPYVLEHFDSPVFDLSRWERLPHALSKDALRAWQEAVLRYASQLSAFWRDDDETRLALRNYLAGGGGRLWSKIAS